MTEGMKKVPKATNASSQVLWQKKSDCLGMSEKSLHFVKEFICRYPHFAFSFLIIEV